MYDSGIKAKDFINELKDEIDIATDISDSAYLFFLNTAEQILYSEIIKEQNVAEIQCQNIDEITTINDMTNPNKTKITTLIVGINVPEDESQIRYEDIHTIYADKNQLIKTFTASENVFPNVHYKHGGYLVCETNFVPELLRIYYNIRPKIKTLETYENDTVKLPYEFLDVIKSKVRGEVYKLVNEDAFAAKWLNDYNVLVETFRVWVEARRAEFGM